MLEPGQMVMHCTECGVVGTLAYKLPDNLSVWAITFHSSSTPTAVWREDLMVPIPSNATPDQITALKNICSK